MSIDTHRARYREAAASFEAALLRFHKLTLKFAADQPRVPAGSPDGGQWTSGGPAASELIADPFSVFLNDLPTLLLAGGFEKEDMGKTVQEFVAEKCKGTISRELPDQFLETTLQDLMAAKKRGELGANKCYKLIHEPRFRKEK